MRQRSRQVLWLRDALTEAGHPRSDAELVGHLMQIPTPGTDFTAPVLAGNDQQRNRVRVSLTHGREDVRESWTRDGETYADPTGNAGVAVRHEAKPLLMPPGHVANAGRSKATIKLEIVHTRNTEYMAYAQRLEGFDEVGTQGLLHA